MDSWFSKCTKVLENIHKIEDENCRGYIFEYFFKFISHRFYKEDRNESITQWILNSKFDLFIYLLFMKHKFLNQELFDHMSEALANCFLVPAILQKFDYFRLINSYEALFSDLRKAQPSSILYLVGILYAVVQKYSYNLEQLNEAQVLARLDKARQTLPELNQENQHNRLFVPNAPGKKKKEPKEEENQRGSEQTDKKSDQLASLMISCRSN